jgi:outer membrane lipopolysaccharide assembly protein LptE/RlpB
VPDAYEERRAIHAEMRERSRQRLVRRVDS